MSNMHCCAGQFLLYWLVLGLQWKIKLYYCFDHDRSNNYTVILVSRDFRNFSK
jgi:hypothetical protein